MLFVVSGVTSCLMNLRVVYANAALQEQQTAFLHEGDKLHKQKVGGQNGNHASNCGGPVGKRLRCGGRSKDLEILVSTRNIVKCSVSIGGWWVNSGCSVVGEYWIIHHQFFSF